MRYVHPSTRDKSRGRTLNDEALIAMIRKGRATRVAKSMRQCIVTTHPQYGDDGAFLAGLCVTVNGQRSQKMTCDSSMRVAFHSGDPDEVIGRVIDMPQGYQIRRGEDCTVGCLIVEVTGCSQLLYIERVTFPDEDDNQTVAWRLRRVRSTGTATGRLGKSVSPVKAALGGRSGRR